MNGWKSSDTYVPVESVEEAQLLWASGLLWYRWVHDCDNVYTLVSDIYMQQKMYNTMWIRRMLRQSKLLVRLEN